MLLTLAIGMAGALQAQEPQPPRQPGQEPAKPPAQQQPAQPAQPPAQQQPPQPAQPQAQPQAQQGQQAAPAMRGKIVRVQGQDQFVIRTADNREMVFYTNPETRYTIRGNAGRFADLQAGSDVNVLYSTRNDRHFVSTVTVGAAAAPPAQGAQATPAQPAPATTINGTVVRVVGQDQVVVRLEGDKEIVVYVTPQTKYTFDDQPGRFTDLQPGTQVRVDYDERDRRPLVRSILGRRIRR
jgi:hypothetical protein